MYKCNIAMAINNLILEFCKSKFSEKYSALEYRGKKKVKNRKYKPLF